MSISTAPMYINTASIKVLDITTSATAGVGSNIDFSAATQVTGTFVGDGSRLNYVTASYLHGRGEVSASLIFEAITDPIDEEEGRLFYSSDTKALTLMGLNQSRLQIGQEMYMYVSNKSGVDIVNGSWVDYSGSVQGDKPNVKLALATTDHERPVLGCATMDIPNNGEGFITTYGHVHNLNTADFASGDVLYLSPTTPGSASNVEPLYPLASTRLGIVLISSANNGDIYVRPVPHFVDSSVTSSHAVVASTLSGSAFIPISGSIYFDTKSIYTPPHKPGHMYWDQQDKTLAICLEKDTRLQVGEEILQRVVAGEKIPNGGVVYNIGQSYFNPTTDTHRAIVKLAQADGTNTRALIMGVATEEIVSGSSGFITIIGDVHSLNTTGMAEGAFAYLSTTQSGSFTTTRPTIPNEIVIVGTITETDATNGTITVNIANPPDISIASLVSAGMTSVPSISLSGSGAAAAVLISSGSCMLYNTAIANDKLSTYLLAPATLSMATTGSPYYITAEYQSGTNTAQYNILTSNSTINGTTVINVYTAIRTIYGAFEYLSWNMPGFALSDKLRKRFVRTRRFEFENVPTITESGSRYVNTSTGTIWYGDSSVDMLASDTRIDGLRYFVHTAANVWSSSLGTGQYNNTQWDNGTGLVTLSGGRYAVTFLFKPVNATDKETYAVLGNQDATLVQAQAMTVPANLPGILNQSSGLAALIGRIIVAKNAATATQIDSVATTTFNPSAASDHNSLGGLQGGVAGEYYHLTAAQSSSINISASYAKTAETASFLTRNRTYEVTSSWAQQALTASAMSSTWTLSTSDILTLQIFS